MFIELTKLIGTCKSNDIILYIPCLLMNRDLSLSVSGKIGALIKPDGSFQHVARWMTFCNAQSPFCQVSAQLPSQTNDKSSQLGVSANKSSVCIVVWEFLSYCILQDITCRSNEFRRR